MVAIVVWWMLGIWFVDVIAEALFDVSPVAIVRGAILRFFKPYDKEVHRDDRP